MKNQLKFLLFALTIITFTYSANAELGLNYASFAKGDKKNKIRK